MRALLAGELAQAQSFYSDVHVKLEVQNGSGTWIDVGASLGKNWIVNASWGEVVDTPVSGATFTLIQQIGTASLSPLMSASALNVNDAGAYSPLLDVGRLVRASTATMAQGVALDTTKYRRIFDGRIDEVDQADETTDPLTIAIRCSDLGAWLQDLQIETSGIQYGTKPTGTALETVIQNIINANIPSGEPAVTLLKQSASVFAVTHWLQGDTKLLEALTTIVRDSTGEDIRYRYDATHASRLTWFNPDRNRTTVDATFTGPQYVLSRLNLAIRDIRNDGAMSYGSGVATATSASSKAKYRRRFFRLEATDSITTLADAQKVIDAVVNDLSAPPGEASGQLLGYFWPVQLYDRYTFAANARQYDTDQTFAVMGYQHMIENGRGTTVLTLTARIVGAYAAWLPKIAPPDEPVAPTPSLTLVGADATSLATTVRAAVAEGTTSGAAMTYTLTKKRGPLAPETLSSGGVQALPVDVVVIRDPRLAVVLTLTVTDPVTGVKAETLTISEDGRDGARGAGHGTGRTDEDDRRGGEGGIPVTGASYTTIPLYDTSGATPLISPSTKTILPGLYIGVGVRGASDVGFGDVIKFAPNRHNEAVIAKNGVTGTFGISFERIPQIRALPQVFRIPGANSTVDRKFEFKATNVTVSGFTARAVSSTGSSATAQTNDFAATLNGAPVAAGISLLDAGASAFCNLTGATVTSTTYRVFFDVNTTSMAAGNALYVDAYVNAAPAGTPTTLVGSATYDIGVNVTGATIVFSAALGADFDVQLVITYETPPTTVTRATVVADRVTYDAITAGVETPLTDDVDGGVLFQAHEAP